MIFKKANKIEEGGFPENMPPPDFMKDFKDPLGEEYQSLDILDEGEFYLYDWTNMRRQHNVFQLRNGEYVIANFISKKERTPNRDHPRFDESLCKFKGIGKLVPPAQGREKYLWFSPEIEDYRKSERLDRYFFELRDGQVVESNLWSSDLKYNPDDYNNMVFLGIGKFYGEQED